MHLTARHIRDIFIYTMPKVIGYALTILTLPILTRILTPEDFGIVAFVWIFPTIAVSLVTMGVINSQDRYYFKYRTDSEKLNEYYCSSQIFLLFSFLVSSLVIFVVRTYIASLIVGNGGYGFAFFVGYVASFISQIVGFYLLLYQYMGKATIYAGISIAQVALTSLLGVIFVWVFRMSYMGMIYGSLLSSVLVCFMVVGFFNRTTTMSFSRVVLWKSMRYGLQLVPKSFSGFVNRFFDKYMLNNMVSLAAVGVYTIGQNVGNSLSLFMSSVGSSFNHLYYQDVFDRGREASTSTGRLFTLFSFISLLPVLCLILFAQEIVFFIAPPRYYEAINIIIILSGAIAPYVFGKYVGVQYAYANKAYWIFPITILATIANVIANIILIPRFGLLGAAFSTMVSSWASNIIITAVGQRMYRIQYEWRTLAAFHSIIIIAMLLVLLMRSYIVQWFFVYGAKGFLLLAFFLAGEKARIVTKDNLGRLFTALRSSQENVNEFT